MVNTNLLKKHAFGFVALIAFILLPLASRSTDMHDTLIRIMIYSIAGEGWNLISGFTGQTSFGHAAYFAVGAYTATLLSNTFDVTPWVGMFAGVALAVLLAGLVNYRLFKLKGHYFAIATLAVCEILRVFCNQWKLLGAGDGMMVKVRTSNQLFWMYPNVRDRLPFLYALLAVLVVVFILCVVLERSRMGFYWKTIRESHDVAESIGINPQKYKLYAMMLSAAISSVAGTFYAQASSYFDASTILTLDMSMVFVLVTVLGGLGNVYGPVIGSAVYYALELMFKRITGATSTGLNLIVFGALIVIIACFQPKGIVGIAQSIRDRFSRSHTPSDGGEGGGEIEANPAN